MNENRSVATIDAPEFLNIEPFNPLISQCEIKVFYLGKNRNGSVITRDVAIQMANSLPGCPIVGAYREEIEDFGDHGHVMRIEDGEVKFSVKTKPYGFVAPDAEVWFKDFIDMDADGNETTRTYLMTTGYLWTGQYEEAQSVLSEGKGQSMELDEKNLEGHWAEDSNSGLDFFIINDAIFSKLCILGDGVEPCFEGAAVTAPNVSKDFATDFEFHRTLFTMMNELKDALESKGGSNMPEEKFEEVVETEQTTEEPVAEFEEVDATDSTEADLSDSPVETTEEVAEIVEDAEVAASPLPAAPNVAVVPGPSVDEPDPKEPDDPKEDEEGEGEETPKSQVDDSDDVDEAVRRLIEHSAEDTTSELEDLRAEVASLREFKHQVELKEKEALIAKYYMLDEGDKAPFIEKIEEYSLEELEAQLALAYVAKNVDFENLGSEEPKINESIEEPAIVFELTEDDDAAGIAPAWVKSLRRTAKD